MKLFIFFLLTCFLSLVPFVRSNKQWLVSFFAILIISILFSFALSERAISSFTDSEFYLNKALSMNGVEDVFIVYNTDYIFWFFAWLAIQLGGEVHFFWWMGGVITFLMIYSIYISCNKFSITKKFFIIAILLLLCTPTYYLQTANTIRQGMVLPLVFLAFFFFAEKKFLFAFPLIFISAFVHGQSTMMALPALGVLLCLVNRKVTFISISLLLFVGFLSQNLVLMILNIVGFDVYINKLMLYKDSWANENNYIKYLISFFIIYSYCFVSKFFKLKYNNEFEKVIFKPYLSLMLIAVMVYPYGEVAARFLSIVSIFEVVIITYIVSILTVKVKQGDIFIPFTIIGCVLVFLLIQYHPSIIHNLNNVSIYYE
ncbi:EpsG family protein [Vibrio parahaemolyticus]